MKTFRKYGKIQNQVEQVIFSFEFVLTYNLNYVDVLCTI